MSRTIQVEVFKLQKIRAVVGSLGKKVSNDARMHKDDKISTLTMLKEVRQILDGWLQLGLFSEAQQRTPNNGPPTPSTNPIPK